jgi:hypothetical protein
LSKKLEERDHLKNLAQMEGMLKRNLKKQHESVDWINLAWDRKQ